MSRPDQLERLEAKLNAALQVATTSFRDALTEPLYDNGVPGPSLAETANVEVTDETPNFTIQYGIRDEMRRWLVPESHRPTCPLSGEPCTSWTCLLDVCVDPSKEA